MKEAAAVDMVRFGLEGADDVAIFSLAGKIGSGVIFERVCAVPSFKSGFGQSLAWYFRHPTIILCIKRVRFHYRNRRLRETSIHKLLGLGG